MRRTFALGLTNAVIVVLVLSLTLLVFGLPIGESIRRLLDGSVSSQLGIERTLVKMTPLLFCGLGMAIAWRAGMYNIGGEGQYIMGGIFAAMLAKVCAFLPPAIVGIVVVIASVIGGAVYALLAGFLQIKRDVNLVISTILLNFIAIQLLSFLVSGPLQEAPRKLPQTDKLPAAAGLAHLNSQSDLHLGVALAILIGVLLQILMFRTVFGFRIRLVGSNARAAEAIRLNVGQIQMRAMALSGALCGLAGGVEYSAMSRVLDTGFPQQWGFLGIPVAMLGALTPFGVVASSLIVGGLFAGSQNMARFGAGGDTIVYVVQALVMLLLVAVHRLRERKVTS